ncbi:MAG: hypothetical protein WCC12_18815 [Anaerolineales bacterium]
MMLNTSTLRTSLQTTLLLTILISLCIHPVPAAALGEGGSALPDFREFSSIVQNGQANVLRGVYVPGILALPVVQQPDGQAGYVSYKDGEITQFDMATQSGNVGLLAHNNLSGKSFSQLVPGQEVRLVYGDGQVEYFVIAQVSRFQALEPNSPYSSFRDLSNDELLTAEQLFNRVYRGDRHVTFQTCIDANGDISWGRLFVIAIPGQPHSEPDLFYWQLPR